MDFKSFPNPFQERDRQLTAEMLSKLLQAVQYIQLPIRLHVQQFMSKQLEPENFEEPQNTFLRSCIQVSHPPGINRVQGNSDGHRFAVSDGEVTELFEFMRTPVSEVKGTRLRRSRLVGTAGPAPEGNEDVSVLPAS